MTEGPACRLSPSPTLGGSICTWGNGHYKSPMCRVNPSAHRSNCTGTGSSPDKRSYCAPNCAITITVLLKDSNCSTQPIHFHMLLTMSGHQPFYSDYPTSIPSSKIVKPLFRSCGSSPELPTPSTCREQVAQHISRLSCPMHSHCTQTFSRSMIECTATDHVIFSCCIYTNFHGNLFPLA